jgi:hypothetical protein
MTLDPHATATVVVTLIVGWIMLTAGLQKSGLELRRRRRVCPSCGRELQAAHCGCH